MGLVRQLLLSILFCCLFVFVSHSQVLENNFGTTKGLLRIEGRLFADSAWDKALNEVEIQVDRLTNGSGRYEVDKDNKPVANPNWEAVYTSVGKTKTDKFGRFIFHVDLYREYRITYLKPSYRKRVIALSTLLREDELKALESKRKDGIYVYSVSGTLEPYKSDIIGPPNENLNSKIQFSAKAQNFTLNEAMQGKHNPAETAPQKVNRNNIKDTRATPNNIPDVPVIQDEVAGKISMVIGGDTVNMYDSNMTKTGRWIHLGAWHADEAYTNTSRVFEGNYNHGLKQNNWIKFHPNSEKALDLKFEKDRFTGAFKSYYLSGEIESEGTFNRSISEKIEDFKMYYPLGGMMADFQYDENGLRDGNQLVYHDNGNLAISAMFEQDKLNGSMIILDEFGNILEQRVYDNGRLFESKTFDGKKANEKTLKLINLLVDDENEIAIKVKTALDELDQIESKINSNAYLQDQMDELLALRSKLTKAELSMLEAQEESKRMATLNELKEEKLRRNNLMLLAACSALVLIAFLALTLLKRNEEKKRTNRILMAQKEEIHLQHEQLIEKNREITDSIHYAKRIQTAILPPERLVKQHLPNSFILYKPKDVVAGDFYWLEYPAKDLNAGGKDDLILFAAADCTGHGVPGAMVSVICNNGLNRSVREFGLRDPGKILDKTRELVIGEFEKSEEEVKDGMDISLCALSLATRTLHWAGANNPLWIARHEAEAMEEIKADKQPIGKYHNETPFASHQINLNAGDTIYIFTDGYPDQFGGETGKKYKSGNFKKRLLKLAQQPIEQQKGILDQEFENWRGTLEQIDDVCVIGVRV